MQFKYFLIGLSVLFITNSSAQKTDTLKITLNDAIDIAQRQSLNAFLAKNTYLAAYWNFQSSYRSLLFPSLNLSTNLLNYTKGYNQVWEDGEYKMRYSERLSNALNVSVNQKVFFTGGEIAVRSSLNHLNSVSGIEGDLKRNRTYTSVPVSVVFTQPLNGYNSFKWKKKIEPLNYEQNKKKYITGQIGISRTTVRVFFDAIGAQIDLTIAEFNYANADTLFRIGSGRFEIGTITQDELLDLELSFLNAQNSLSRAKTNLLRAQNELNSFLRIDPGVAIKCIPPDEIPLLKIEIDEALEKSYENNPQMLAYEQQLLTAEREVAQAKADRFEANLRLEYGITNADDNVLGSYHSPYDDDQTASIGLSMPIIDWGGKRGQYLMAKSNMEVDRYTVEQSKIDFEKNVVQTVLEYNLQEEQVKIAKKADYIGRLGYDVTKQRFMIGKVDVIRLNAARTSMENARKSYINAIESYWSYYYNIQQLTLYDFANKQALLADYEKLVQDQKFGK